MFVSIDPGATTGWALWNVNGLIACGLGDPRADSRHRVTTEQYVDVVDDVWIEAQVIYPRSKSRPADILTLAVGAGRWAGRYDAIGVEAHFIQPHDWKGGPVPKAIHQPRIWAALRRRGEDHVVSRDTKGMSATKAHNVVDAVGIGLWVHERTKGRGR